MLSVDAINQCDINTALNQLQGNTGGNVWTRSVREWITVRRWQLLKLTVLQEFSLAEQHFTWGTVLLFRRICAWLWFSQSKKKANSVRALPWQPCLCCLGLMFRWLFCVLTHCFVFVCVYHVFLWSHLLVSLGHAPLFSPCLVLVSLTVLTWPSCAFLPLYCAVFLLCHRDSYQFAALYSSLALSSCILTAVLLLSLYLWFCLVLFLSNLACLLIIFHLFVYQSCF